MKKKCKLGDFIRIRLLGVSLVMKLAFFLFPLQGVASNNPQHVKVSLSLKNIFLTEAFLKIQKSSDYSFVYNVDDVKNFRVAALEVENASIEEVLTRCLKDTGLTYKIEDNVVIILQKPQDERFMILKGWVYDVKKQAMPGVTVKVAGTMLGTATNGQGWFYIHLPKSKGQLEFSFVGYKTQRVDFTENTDTLCIIMREDVKEMEEVVVTGYQTMRKSEVVGSHTVVDASDIMMPAYSSIDQMLQGRVAGMTVVNTSSRVGHTPKIRIRGTSTILGNQDPLWVVDGIIQPDPLPIDQNDMMVDDLRNILGNQISWLNPADIETITVLKDASATAIYGSKAANGVIVITTKRGRKGSTTVNYSANFSFRARPHYSLFNLMNSKERIEFSREAFESGAIYSEAPVASMDTYEGIMYSYYNKNITASDAREAILKLANTNTNWLKLLTRNSFSQTHNLSVSGGSDKVTYSASLGFTDQAGVEIGNDAKNMSGRVNTSIQVHPKVLIDVTLLGSINKTGGYAAGVNPLSYATNTSRSLLAYEDDGSLHYQKQRGYYQYNSSIHYLGYNILNEMEHSYSKNKSSQVNGILNFAWEILPGLKYEFVGGINNNTSVAESYAGEQTNYIAGLYRGYDYGTETYGSEKYNAAALPYGGELYNRTSDVLSWNIQNKLIFMRSFKENHRLNVLIGTETVSSRTSDRSSTIYGYVKERGESIMRPTPLDELKPIGNAPIVGWGILDKLYDGSGWTRTSQLSNSFSVFATLAYVFKDRYVLNASIRNDASNRFGQNQNKRFDPTYSFGLSWNAAHEPWMQGISNIVNQLNFRASFGIQGNTVNSIGPELILDREGIKQGYGEYFSTISRIPNPNLSWERTKTWNFGIDIQLAWITMNLEYYRKMSNNIVNQGIAPENGIAGMDINGGRIRNSGVEYSLNITPIRTKDWGWTIGLNSSKNWNKALTQSIDEITLQNYLDGASDRVLQRGKPLSAFWSFDFRGLNPNTGMPEFNRIFVEDEQGVFLIDEATGNYELLPVAWQDILVYSGKTEPDFTGGLTTRLRWKGLTLGANFSVLLGGKQRLPGLFPDENGNIPLSSANLNKNLLKRWKKPGDEKFTSIPAVYNGRIINNISLQDGKSYSPYMMWHNSNARVVSSSFFRCQQISLTWNMNESLCNKMGIKNLSLNAIMNNVFVLASKRFDGFDPELGDSVQPKTYSVGITVGF